MRSLRSAEAAVMAHSFTFYSRLNQTNRAFLELYSKTCVIQHELIMDSQAYINNYS